MDHEYVESPNYSGTGCAFCGNPREHIRHGSTPNAPTAKTCKSGKHEMTPDNVVFNGEGFPACRRCAYDNHIKWNHQKRVRRFQEFIFMEYGITIPNELASVLQPYTRIPGGWKKGNKNV